LGVNVSLSTKFTVFVAAPGFPCAVVAEAAATEV
jgi:hypothetical protein